MIVSATTASGRRGTRSLRRHSVAARTAEGAWAYLFLLPWFIGLFGLVLGPLVVSFALSLTNFDLLSSPHWTGLSNYARMLDDGTFWQALRVTATYVLVGVPLKLTFALLIALALDRGLSGLNFYRSLFYLPSLFGGSVAVAVLWRQLFGESGLVNQILERVGIHGSSWISNPSTALSTLIVLEVWQFGAPMVIFLAGLRQIPRTYYDAATVDGASRRHIFGSITLPLLSPIVFFNLVLQIIGSFQAFTPAYVISDGSGGPADSTMFYTLYLYQEGFVNYRMGYASALAWVLLLIIAVLTGLNFLAGRRWVHYEH